MDYKPLTQITNVKTGTAPNTIGYMHIVRPVTCNDCKHEFNSFEIIHKTKIVSQNEYGTSMTGHSHCPKCDSENITILPL